MGVLSALPEMNRVVLSLGGPGVLPVDSSGHYPIDKDIVVSSSDLFVDSCHPTGQNNRLLARKIAAALAPKLRERME